MNSQTGRTPIDLLFWAAENPGTAALVVIGIALVALAVYALLRWRGIDVIPPLLEMVRLTVIKPAYDISGDWEYRCTVQEQPHREWGGTVTIKQHSTRHSTQWRLTGFRRWELVHDPAGAARRQLTPPLPWKTAWGTITEDGGVRFGYSTTLATTEIKGYSEGEIQTEGSKPSGIDGVFYQLPPGPAVQGVVLFRRPGHSVW